MTTSSDDAIRFILDGEVKTVRQIDPNTTVLDYLREDLRRTGTKEGCAEGDCGACTVVLGELDGDRVRFRAINSCIKFMPTLDGKELFTVESLRAGRRLAPCAACDGRMSWIPMWVLHTWDRHVLVRALFKSEADPSRPPNQRPAGWESVPLHRISADRRRRQKDVRIRQRARTVLDPEPLFTLRRRRGVARRAGDGGATPSHSAEQGVLALTGPSIGGGEHSYFAPTELDRAGRASAAPTRRQTSWPEEPMWVFGSPSSHVDLGAIIYVGNVGELKQAAGNRHPYRAGGRGHGDRRPRSHRRALSRHGRDVPAFCIAADPQRGDNRRQHRQRIPHRRLDAGADLTGYLPRSALG